MEHELMWLPKVWRVSALALAFAAAYLCVATLRGRVAGNVMAEKARGTGENVGNDSPSGLPKDAVVLTGVAVLLPDIPAASWCASGEHPLGETAEANVAGLLLSRDAKGMHLRGKFVRGKANERRKEYGASRRGAVQGGNAGKDRSETLQLASLKNGTNVEIFGESFINPVVIRVEESWRGIVWGVVSGWEFQLDAEKLTIVDADMNGRVSRGDRIIYGDRTVWMPWHTVLVSGRTIYHDLTVAGPDSLTARVRPMENPGVDTALWNTWQEFRKDQGIPPGLFSRTLQEYCVSHATYLKINKIPEQGGNFHIEDPRLPGFTAGGQAAAQLACISAAMGRKTAIDSVADMWKHLDSLYHRWPLLSPFDVGLMCGGIDCIRMMGQGLGPGLPSEARVYEQPQCYPAPNSTVPHGVYYTKELPRHPILDQSRQPGLPITVRVGSEHPVLDNVMCQLYAVTGDRRTGKRADEIGCHVSYAGHNTPPSFPGMSGMIALTPLQPLNPGTYEAHFRFMERDSAHDLRWRFGIGK